MSKKNMTNDLRKRISEYKKTRVDIAPLISNRIIKGEDLSNCFISELNVTEQDISGCNFSGTEMKFLGVQCNAKHCNFINVKFLPGSNLRGGDFRHSNFSGAFFPFIDYAYSDFRGANVCGAVFTFSTRLGYKAKLSSNVLDILKKWWDIQDGPPMIEPTFD